MVKRNTKHKVAQSEIDIERQLAYAQTILSPRYLQDKIKEYQDEIDRCKSMQKFYKKQLKEVMNPSTHSGQLSRRYKLQEYVDITNA